MQELRALGVRLSVDDFGTGQSSLAYLKQLPVHEMKIHKAFVLGLADDQGNAAIVRAASSLGHALGLRVVAEGVEDAVTLSLLADWGCDLVQGYYISGPLQSWVVEVDRPVLTGSSARRLTSPHGCIRTVWRRGRTTVQRRTPRRLPPRRSSIPAGEERRR
jgi:EAL domain-containing protein (putative c-di-GMP-specific phosphodiesterase class I)